MAKWGAIVGGEMQLEQCAYKTRPRIRPVAGIALCDARALIAFVEFLRTLAKP